MNILTTYIKNFTSLFRDPTIYEIIQTDIKQTLKVIKDSKEALEAIGYQKHLAESKLEVLRTWDAKLTLSNLPVTNKDYK